jgi:hypothetical protein
MRSMPHPPTVSASTVSELAPLQIIRTETVLSRMPIHNLAKKGKVDIQIIKKNEHGEVDLRWEVSYSDRYGQPRQLAYKLDTLVINKHIDELDRPLPKIIRMGSLRDIADELGLGGDTNNVRKAFRQNAFVGISAKLSYKTLDGREKRLEVDFTRYSVVFTGESLPDGNKADAVYLILNDPYREVLNNAPTRPLDYDYLKQLAPAAQRFYEIVSYKIFAALKFKHPRAKLPYSEYCTFSAQQRYYDYDHVKKQMYKIHKPHLASGYIEKVSIKAIPDSDGKPDWIMSYIPGPKARAEFKAFNSKHSKSTNTLDQESVLPLETSEESAPDNARNLVQYFYRRFHHNDDVTPTTKELEFAAALITQYGMDKARFVVEYSQESADATKYKPDMLIGIRKYVDAAIKKFDLRAQRQQEAKQKKQDEQLHNLYEAYRDQELARIKSSMPPDELAALESSIRADLKAKGINPLVLEMQMRHTRDEQLERRARVLPFEKWRKQQALT